MGFAKIGEAGTVPDPLHGGVQVSAGATAPEHEWLGAGVQPCYYLHGGGATKHHLFVRCGRRQHSKQLQKLAARHFPHNTYSDNSGFSVRFRISRLSV